jgi:hypothetical protein
VEIFGSVPNPGGGENEDSDITDWIHEDGQHSPRLVDYDSDHYRSYMDNGIWSVESECSTAGLY